MNKDELLDKLVSILAKANIAGEITMIESLMIKDAFIHGYEEASKICRMIGQNLKEGA